MLEVSAGFVVGAAPSLIAPEESSVNTIFACWVERDPSFEYFVVTLILYVVAAVNPPKEVWVESVKTVCIGEAKVVSALDVIITLYEPTLLSAGAVHDAVAIESVADTAKLVTTDAFALVSFTAIGLFDTAT